MKVYMGFDYKRKLIRQRFFHKDWICVTPSLEAAQEFANKVESGKGRVVQYDLDVDRIIFWDVDDVNYYTQEVHNKTYTNEELFNYNPELAQEIQNYCSGMKLNDPSNPQIVYYILFSGLFLRNGRLLPAKQNFEESVNAQLSEVFRLAGVK